MKKPKNADVRQCTYWRCAASLAIFFLLLFATQPAEAQGQSTGKLTVTMTVQPSIQLVFQNDANVGRTGYCPLTDANTNAVGLDLGTAWGFGLNESNCTTYTNLNNGNLGAYQVSSIFDVMVTKANSTSGSYRLQANLSSTPGTGVTWLINNSTLPTTPTYTTLATNGTYGRATQETLKVQIASWTTPAGTESEIITFVATAN